MPAAFPKTLSLTNFFKTMSTYVLPLSVIIFFLFPHGLLLLCITFFQRNMHCLAACLGKGWKFYIIFALQE